MRTQHYTNPSLRLSVLPLEQNLGRLNAPSQPCMRTDTVGTEVFKDSSLQHSSRTWSGEEGEAYTGLGWGRQTGLSMELLYQLLSAPEHSDLKHKKWHMTCIWKGKETCSSLTFTNFTSSFAYANFKKPHGCKMLLTT